MSKHHVNCAIVRFGNIRAWCDCGKGDEAMREDHHIFEEHTETADDNFCDQCFGYHHWNANCPEDGND